MNFAQADEPGVKYIKDVVEERRSTRKERKRKI